MYWDEDLLLDLRMNILNKVVDYFVIVEGNKTWQNNHKEFRFNIENFKKFETVGKPLEVPNDLFKLGQNTSQQFQHSCLND